MNNLIKTLILSCILTVASFQLNAQCIDLNLPEPICLNDGTVEYPYGFFQVNPQIIIFSNTETLVEYGFDFSLGLVDIIVPANAEYSIISSGFMGEIFCDTVVNTFACAGCIELELLQEPICDGNGNMDLFVSASNTVGGTVYYTDFAGNQFESTLNIDGSTTITLPNTYYNITMINPDGETECSPLLSEPCDACEDLDIYDFNVSCVSGQSQNIQFYFITTNNAGAELQIMNAVTGNIAYQQTFINGNSTLVNTTIPNAAYTVSLIGGTGCDIVFDLPTISCEALPCTPYVELDENSFTAAYNCNSFQDFTYYFSNSYNTNSAAAYATQFIVSQNDTIIYTVDYPDFYDLVMDGFLYETYCLAIINYSIADGLVAEVGQAFADITNDAGETLNDGACMAISECFSYGPPNPQFVEIFNIETTCISADSFTLSLETYIEIYSSFPEGELAIFDGVYNTSIQINESNVMIEVNLPNNGNDYNVNLNNWEILCLALEIVSPPNCDGCNFGNPLTTLDWLSVYVGDPNTSITEYTYNGESVFFVGVCTPFPDALSTLYDCQGNTICGFGGIGGQDGEECPGFPEAATLVNVWKECGATLCNETNPFLIDAFEDLLLVSSEVIQCTTPNGMTVYLFEECAAAFDGFNYSIYDCQGGFLCGEGGFAPSTCDEYIDQLTYVQHYWAGFNDATLDLSCTPLDCNGVLLGSAVFDDCGNCLATDDPDFDNCSYEESYTTCIDSVLSGSVPGIAGYSMPGFILFPDDGVFDFSTPPTGNGLDFTYTPDTAFNGIDTIGISWISDEDGISYVTQYFYITVAACDEVWPGDVNNSGLANNLDLIYLGLEYNKTGPARPNASNNWEGQLMTDWDDTQIIDINSKFADCTGDGQINLADRDVILMNYGQEHDLGKTSAEGTPLFVELPTTIQEGEAVTIPIILGNMDEMVEDFYGIAFTIEFPSEYVLEEEIDVDFTSAFLGTADQNVMGLHYVHFANGQIDVGISKIDELQANGFGDIAYLSIVMIDDIIGKTDTSIPFTIDITNITAISRDGSEVEIAGTQNETEITPTGIDILVLDTPFSFYPNPTTDYLIVEGSDIQNIQIFDINGKMILSQQADQQFSSQIDLSGFGSGIYLLGLESVDGSWVYNKIEIMK